MQENTKLEFALNRSGGVCVRTQLAAQIKLKILAGELPAGQKLPSVRSLARRLKIHPNTVSAIYKGLIQDREIVRTHGSGVYVRGGVPLEDAPSDLDELLATALRTAFRQGFGARAIRAGVKRWLSTPPASRIVVVDTNQETADLLAYEIRERIGAPASSCTLSAAVGNPSLLVDAVAATWPLHAEALRRLIPEGSLAILRLCVSPKDAQAMVRLPQGAVALVVSHSPRVLPYASGLLSSVRRDDVVVKCCLLSDGQGWTDMALAADLVFADAMALDSVRRVRTRCVREIQLVSDEARAEIRQLLAFPVPRVRRHASDAIESDGNGVGGQTGSISARSRKRSQD